MMACQKGPLFCWGSLGLLQLPLRLVLPNGVGMVINNLVQFCTVKPVMDSHCFWYWGVTKVSFGAEYHSPIKICLEEHKMKIFICNQIQGLFQVHGSLLLVW